MIGDRRGGELEVFAKKVAIAVAAGLFILLLWHVRAVLILVFIAAVLAAGIAPAVHRVRVVWRFWFHRNLDRGKAVAIVYLPFLILVLSLALLLVPQLMADWNELRTQLPRVIESNILKPLEKYVPMNAVREALRDGAVPQNRVFGYVRSAATV